MPVLIDSDILIEILRARDAQILRRWSELAEMGQALLCSPVSWAEVWRGARPKEHAAIQNLLNALICVPVNAETGRMAGDFLRAYDKSHDLQLGDVLIAASAVENHADLWTRNRKRYPMKNLRFF